MGFDELNKQGLRIDVTPPGYETQTKQIDVLARWQKEILVIECKAAEERAEGLDRRDLSDLYERKPRILRAIYDEYGRDSQVTFMFWLKFVIPNDGNLADLDRFRCSLLDYDDLQNYLGVAKLVGSAAKFQLFADLYGPRRQGIRWHRRVPAIMGRLAGHTFYLFMAEPQKLLPLANVPRVRPIGQRRPHEEERSRILYQRMLNSRKLHEINEYIMARRGFFPNNLVVSFASRPNFRVVESIERLGLKMGLLSVPSEYGSITIIDGQHRLFGYSDVEGENHLIPVLAFEELDADEQGELFVTINSKQKKVDSNILWDLHEYFGGSVKATISRTVKELNRRPDSPFQHLIIVPSETRKIGLPLKMTALCTALESAGIIEQLQNGDSSSDTETGGLAADLVSWYFRLARDFDETTVSDWRAGRQGFLCTNNGVSSLVFLLDAILRNIQSTLTIESPGTNIRDLPVSRLQEMIGAYVRPAIRHVTELTVEERSRLRRSSSKGQQVAFTAELKAKIREAIPEFRIIHSRPERVPGATEFEELMQRFVVLLLREELGDQWYRGGVPGELRDRIAQTIARRGYDPGELDDEQKIAYSDLGTLGQIILRRFARFQPVLGVDRAVFEAQLSWMNAYRSGHGAVHTGDTQTYVSLMGRGAMGHYNRLVSRFLESRLSTTSTQEAREVQNSER